MSMSFQTRTESSCRTLESSSGTDAALVIDTGMGPPNVATVLEEVTEIASGRALYLVVTHSHAEHVSGASAFPPETTFVGSLSLLDALDQLPADPFGGMARLSPAIGEMVKDAALRRPDVIFEGEHVLDLGGVHVRLLEMPTHTPTDTVAFVEGDRVLFAGDVVMKERFLSFGARSTRNAWLEAFGRIRVLDPLVIVPSHGPLADLSALAEQEHVLDEMFSRVRELKAAGDSLDATTARVVGELKARFPGWQSTVPNEIGPIIRSLYAE